jgi:dTDP-4-amino-4,6-dideoxygalactose transaminase
MRGKTRKNTMDIPITDLKLQYVNIREEIDAAVKTVLAEANFVLGKELSLLEGEIAEYFGIKYAIGVASGTDALILSLTGLGIGKGDEVITTPFTFIATAEAISRVGAKPVFCDITSDTYNIDADKIEAKITPRTKAVIPVHLYGMPCEMDKIMAIAKRHNLKVVEDCAQSFGSEYKSRKVGSFGDCGALSFFPAKTLGGYGDGGMVLTNDEATAGRIKMLRDHGSSTKYHYSMHGFNSRLDTLQAAVLRVKLRHVDAWITQRIKDAQYYNELLSSASLITVPKVSKAQKHAFNYYTIRIKGGRNRLQQALKEKGIASAIYYPLSLHLQEVYRDLGYKMGDFAVAEQSQDEVLSLPLYPELAKEQIQRVTEAIKEAL